MSIKVFGYAVLTLASGTILLAAGTVAWWTLDRVVPVEVQQTEVLTPHVRPGGSLMLRQRVDYIRDCSAHVDRAVYDNVTHREFLVDIDYDRPPLGLGVKTITFEVEIPPFFEPGAATYRAKPSYACNPLQRFYWPITRPETVIEFAIVPR